MLTPLRLPTTAAVIAATALLTACGGGGGGDPTATYTVKATVSNLNNEGLVLAAGNREVEVAAGATNVALSFEARQGQPYEITVRQQPQGFQKCSVANGSGTLTQRDISNVSISCVQAAAVVATFAGHLTEGGNVDGPKASARFEGFSTLAIDNTGAIYFSDGGTTIRKVSPAGDVSTIAGSGEEGSDDGPALQATFDSIYGIVVDPSGTIYASDTSAHVIRKITPDGQVSTLAGTAGVVGSNDGTASAASFYSPEQMTLDKAGNIYLVDRGNRKIRKITPAGVVTTVAGSGAAPPIVSGQYAVTNGAGQQATFASPEGIALDTAGNVYVADACRIRKITPDGMVSTWAGLGTCGDDIDGPASTATLNYTSQLAMDRSGNLYFLSFSSGLVRRASPDGTVSTLAGNPNAVFTNVDGIGSAAAFATPQGIVVDSKGDLYVGSRSALRKISAQ